jgi:hypothetical protein
MQGRFDTASDQVPAITNDRNRYVKELVACGRLVFVLTGAGGVTVWAVHGTAGRWHQHKVQQHNSINSINRTHGLEQVLQTLRGEAETVTHPVGPLRLVPEPALPSRLQIPEQVPEQTTTRSTQAQRLRVRVVDHDGTDCLGQQPPIAISTRSQSRSSRSTPFPNSLGSAEQSITSAFDAQLIVGDSSTPCFRQIATIDPGNDADTQFVKSMFLNKSRGELLFITVKRNMNQRSPSASIAASPTERDLIGSERAPSLYMQLRSLRLGALIRATQTAGTSTKCTPKEFGSPNTRTTLDDTQQMPLQVTPIGNFDQGDWLFASETQNVSTAQPAAVATNTANHRLQMPGPNTSGHELLQSYGDVSPILQRNSYLRPGDENAAGEGRSQVQHLPDALSQEVPFATPDGYRPSKIASLKTRPLLVGFPERSISSQGWCEFDDSRQMFITCSSRSSVNSTPHGRSRGTPRHHTVSEKRYLCVWSLLSYEPMFSFCCDDGAVQAAGDTYDDVKLADGVLLILTKRVADAKQLPVHVYSLHNGQHLRRLVIPLVPKAVIQSLECTAESLILKQYKQPAQFFSLRTGRINATMATSNANRCSPSFVFLAAHQLFISYSNSRVRTVNLAGQTIASMDVLHCSHGTSCSTTNVFVAEDQRTLYGYCYCSLHAVYAISVVCTFTGSRIREWSSENMLLSPGLRHALRDVTSLYVHQQLNIMLTGHADGTVNSWIPRGSP